MSTITAEGGMPANSAHYPSLRAKRVFITGGGSGIGACLVEAFARQGSRVAFVDVAVRESEQLVQTLRASGFDPPWFRVCDVADVAALQAAIGAAATALGDFNVLVNNVASDERHAIADVTPQYWDQRMAVNQRPAFFAIQAVLPGMQRAGGGSIVNIGSRGWQAKSAGYPAYATAKASAMGLTRGLAKELGSQRIRINVVSPGWVMTERQLRLWAVPDMADELARIQCVPDPIQAHHIAAMVLFLASEDAAACTAQEFVVDAGWT
jgi:NAD(P)-dependent dehydrogenase (short-subunit alcohol dehydrogenase family)